MDGTSTWQGGYERRPIGDTVCSINGFSITWLLAVPTLIMGGKNHGTRKRSRRVESDYLPASPCNSALCLRPDPGTRQQSEVYEEA
jgi:hypothetical protein